jgi:hypothetical protein
MQQGPAPRVQADANMRTASSLAALALVACAHAEPMEAATAGYAPTSVALFEADQVSTACREAEIPDVGVARGRAVEADDQATLDAVAQCMANGPLHDATVGVTSGDDATATRVKQYLVAHGANAARIVTGVQPGARADAAEINVLTPAARMPVLPETLPREPEPQAP